MRNSLDEAIKYYEEKTESLYKAIPCDGCAFEVCKSEHRQLVKWLKELKEKRKLIRKIKRAYESDVYELEDVINEL